MLIIVRYSRTEEEEEIEKKETLDLCEALFDFASFILQAPAVGISAGGIYIEPPMLFIPRIIVDDLTSSGYKIGGLQPIVLVRYQTTKEGQREYAFVMFHYATYLEK